MAPRGARVLRFGDRGARRRARARRIAGRIESGAFVTVFTLAIGGEQARVRLPLAGRHNVSNALGAAAAAHAAGVALPAIVAGLERMRPVSGRLQLKPGLRGSWLIDDSYNANPSSVRAGIDVLCGPAGRALAGARRDGRARRRDGRRATPASATTRGARASRACSPWAPRRATPSDAFGARASWYADAADLGDALAASLEPGVTALVKGSRVNRLERVVERLAAPLPATPLPVAGNGN